MTSQPNERVFRGRSASPGISVGPAFRLSDAARPGGRDAGAPGEESALLDRSLRQAAAEIDALARDAGALGAEILEFQLALLEDDDLLQPVRDAIAAGSAADVAWASVMDGEIADYAAADDEYMAARASDLADLRGRVLGAMSGGAAASAIPDGAIVLADDLAPSAFLSLDWSRLGGAALSQGSATSHVAILARSRGVPMLVDVAPAPDAAPGDLLALDAGAGSLVVAPNSETLRDFDRRRRAEAELDAAASAVERRPAVTADGRPVRIYINVNEPSALDGLSPEICDGIGLTRTEFLFADGPPDEEEQYRAYARLVGWAAGRPVTIRTLDAGGDKPVANVTIGGESNPFLGVRGLRLSLRRQEVFATQLRALARAAALGTLKIMLPMVTLPQELEQARRLLDEAIAGLERDGVAHARPELGIMVEVPAAALTAQAFAADFYSIGSNDLVQYVMAAARDAAGLSALTAPDHPAVLELIRRTAAVGRARGVDVSICGDMASMPEHVATLIGCGLDILSVAPGSVGRVKLAVAETVAGKAGTE